MKARFALRPRRVAHVLGLASAVLALVALPLRAETSFAGKTVTLLVNFAAGSSTDVFARMFQPHLAKHLPGQPTVIVVNRPGAGGLNAATHFYAAVPPDGMTIALFATLPAQVLATGGSDFRFDIEKFGWLGAISTVSALLVAKDSGLTTADDLGGRRGQIYLAAPTLRGPNTVMGRLMFDMLGIPYNVVTGYRSQPETVSAVEKGEATAAYLNVNVYVRRKDALAQSGVRAILQQGYQGADGKVVGAPQAGVPEADAVLRRLVPGKIGGPEYRAYAALRVGSSLVQTFLLPPGATPELIATVRKVVQASIDDPEFQAAITKSGSLPVNFMPGEDGLRLLGSALADAKAPEIRAVLDPLLQSR